MNFTPIHKHLILSLEVRNEIEDTEAGRQFLLDVVNAVGMVPVTFPQCVFVTTPGNKGLTGSINLATSHVAFHHWTETGLLMFDLYSCCEFDKHVVLEVIDNYFNISETYSSIVLSRETS